MSRICKVFENKKAVISFLTAGDPSIEKSGEFILALAEAGSDLIKIGIPFSDPVAQSEPVQKANSRALAAGARTDKIFGMVSQLRSKTQVPLIFSTYMNPVFAYGIEIFLQNCEKCGVDGLIIHDLPFEERGEILGVSREYGLDLINVIAPATKERITTIAKDATGFIHIIPPFENAETGRVRTDINDIVADIRQVSRVPLVVGVDIATNKQAAETARISDGVIVSGAIAELIEQHGDAAAVHLSEYVKSLKHSIADIC